MNENLPFRCGEDMAGTWIEDELEIVDPFLNAGGVFRCRPSVGRLGRKEIEVEHLLGQPADESTLRILEATLARELTPSHRAVLSRWNGCTLFSRVNNHDTSGIRLFSAEELPACQPGRDTIFRELDRSQSALFHGPCSARQIERFFQAIEIERLCNAPVEGKL